MQIIRKDSSGKRLEEEEVKDLIIHNQTCAEIVTSTLNIITEDDEQN